MDSTPRTRTLADTPPNLSGDYILYWMTAARRSTHSHGLDRALAWARELNRPLRVVEPLQYEHEHGAHRHHAFVVAGMRDNLQAFSEAGVRYEARPGLSRDAARKLFDRAVADACVVVSDEWPTYFLAANQLACARRCPVRYELVDSCGLVPMSAPGKVFARAHDFRRWCQKNFEQWWPGAPTPDPLAEAFPREELVRDGWLGGHLDDAALAKLELDPDALPYPNRIARIEDEGGPARARAYLERFVSESLSRYGERNQPAADAQSRLSPYLHWGQISSHEVLSRVLEEAPEWDPGRIAMDHCRGQREGWWGLPAPIEGFLDQILTWREVGFNGAWHTENFAGYSSLPKWARATLEQHALDDREHLYGLEQFEQARTHDEIWNAAQRELVQTGRMHNYLRMLWGKKILHWSASPHEAMRIMVLLNDRYALDGRDPNSYTGIGWVLGRHDRAWGPEREVFGKIRYMSSDSTRRKLRLGDYLQRFGPGEQLALV